jgi:hypothetical protein
MVPYAPVVPINSYSLVPATFNYLGVQSTQLALDPIQAQILQSTDPALKVYELFESGKAAEFWNYQLKQPCATGLGRTVDAFCGQAYALYKIAVRSIFHQTFNPEENSGIAKRELSSDAMNCSSNEISLREKSEVNISFIAEMHNNQCERLDPAQYSVKVWFKGPAENEICKILRCVQDKFSKLQDLIPCISAPEINRTYDTLYKIFLNTISFEYFEGNEIWILLVSKKNHTFYNSSSWQYNQVFNTLADSLYQCEKDEIDPNTVPYALPTSVQIAIMISGIIFIQGVVFSVYKLCRKKEGEEQPLIAEV